MTTPHRLKRRQQRIGFYVIALTLASLAYGVWDSDRAHDRDVCMSKSFAESSDAQLARVDLATEAGQLQTEMDELQNKVILDVAAARGTSEVVKAFNTFHDDLDKVERLKRHLQHQREKTPLPDFPQGKCE